MEFHKKGKYINPEIAGDLVAKTLRFNNPSRLMADYAKGEFSQKAQIIHCGTKLPEAPVKEQLGFLQVCRNYVKEGWKRLKGILAKREQTNAAEPTAINNKQAFHGATRVELRASGGIANSGR